MRKMSAAGVQGESLRPARVTAGHEQQAERERTVSGSHREYEEGGGGILLGAWGGALLPEQVRIREFGSGQVDVP